MSKDYYRNKEDHITDNSFETFKCTVCKKQYYRMGIYSLMTVCPPCENRKEANEADI